MLLVKDQIRDVISALIVHNRYQRVGGEDIVVQAEVQLLRSMGAHVVTMIYDSRDEQQLRRLKRRPDQLVFNRATYAEARTLIRRHKVQLVHCHNLVPLLSTSIYSAARVEGVPIVQTVHNYRAGCLNGLHLREGQICERCRPGHHIAGMALGCYRDSRLQSVAFGLAQTFNAWRGIWQQPAIYITPGQFLRERLINWGIPAEKIVIKPHFVPYDPGLRSSEGSYAIFVGRLSPEKGLDMLLDVWRPDRLPLVIVGDGPLRVHLEQRAHREGLANVRFVGHQDAEGVHALLREARFLIMPSVWFETFGLVAIEAYAHGVPVVATRLGALADVVRDGITGVLFQANDRAELATQLDDLEHDPRRIAAMGSAARLEFERSYSAEANVGHLHAIYARAIAG